MVNLLKLKKLDKKLTKDQAEYDSSFQILWRELVKDKVAFVSLIFVGTVILVVCSVPLVLNQDEMVKIDLFSINQPPSSEFWLGTDQGGRDIFGQLIIGARNSLAVGGLVTLLSGFIGVLLGIISGYFGGRIDSILMRFVDFSNILPALMIIIAFVTAVPNYTILQFSLIMTLFRWTSIARLVRSRTLQERELEYVQASKTLGTSNLKTIFVQIFPNLSSLIIVMMTLNLAGNIGLESGLSFLGFGFPDTTPSLGTLVSAARNPQNLEMRWWIWMPASLLIFMLMLSINNMGQALKRAADARQRRG